MQEFKSILFPSIFEEYMAEDFVKYSKFPCLSEKSNLSIIELIWFPIFL